MIKRRKFAKYKDLSFTHDIRGFDKVDRALEIAVIDWLQWADFPESLIENPDGSDMAQLTLTLLNKRKQSYSDLLKLANDMALLLEGIWVAPMESTRKRLCMSIVAEWKKFRESNV